MKKLSKIVVLCLTLVLAIGMTFVLTACDDNTNTPTENTIPTYKVSFVLNYLDGTEAFATSVSVKKGKMASEIDGSTISLDDAKFAGYTYNNEKAKTFDWYTSADCTDKFDFGTPINDNIVLYAKLAMNGKETNADLKSTAPLSEQTESIRVMKDGESKEEFVSLGVWMYKYSNTQYAIPNEEYVFDFNIKFADICDGANATYTVYSDEKCTYIAGDDANKSQIVTLENGNNYYYVKVFAEDTRLTKIYKVNVYLEPKYSVSVQTIEGNSTTKNTTKVLANSLLVEPDLTGVNPGYAKDGWYYYTKEKRSEKGQIIDDNGEVLIIEDGVYYVADDNGNKRFVYADANGIKVIREGNKYYKADKSGSYVFESGAKIEIPATELYNVLDKNGLPTYEEGYPITGKGNYMNVWSFDKTVVTEDYTHIFCRWTQETYTVKLTFSNEDSGAKFGGKSAELREISFDVKYGTSAAALADLIKSATAGVDPVKDYASFDGWYYGDMKMVGANAQGVSGYNVVGPAKFVAKFKDNAYTINVTANDSTMAKSITGVGTSCKYGDVIQLGAVANEGYQLIGWTKNGKAWTDFGGGTLDNPKYPLDINDIKDGAVNFTAIFEAKTIAISFDSKSSITKTINVEYNSLVTLGDGATDIPNVPRVSQDMTELFVGWYYVNGEGEDVYIVTYKNGQNEISADFEKWTFTTDTTIYAKWKEYNFTITAYKAMLTNTNMGDIAGWTSWTNVDDISYIPYKLVGKQLVANNGDTIELGVTTVPDYYKFVGWYLIDESAKDPFDFANMTAIKDGEGQVLAQISVVINEADVIYVALWEYNSVTVNFNDVATAIDPATAPFNSSNFTLPVGTTTDDDKEFVGWFDISGAQYTDENGKAIRSITNKDFITDGLNLYAKFQAINYFNVVEGVITGLSEKGAEKVAKGKNVLVINTDDGIMAIDRDAFNGNTTIKSITINGNIQVIGENAFANSAIEAVTFSGNFKGLYIQSGAFANCLKLTSIAFPANTIELEGGVLDGSYNITSITYPGSVVLGSLFTTENPYNDNNWYPADQGGITYYIPTALKTVTVLSNLFTAIEPYAFQNCVLLETVTLGANTMSIGDYAFAITNTTLADDVIADIVVKGLENVKAIYNYAFAGSNIKAVSFKALEKLGIASFKNTKKLATADFSLAPIDTITNNTFENSGLTTVSLTDIKFINAYAFMNAKSLATINNAGAIQSLGEKAFYGCSSFNSVNISKLSSVTDIAAYALDDTAYFNRTSATGSYVVGKVLYYSTATVGSTVEKIAPYAMTKVSGSLNLTTATSLKFVESNAFAGNMSITSVIFPSTILMIKDNAFNGATSLNTIDFATNSCKNLVSIGKSAFEGCTSLTNVSFYTIANADELNIKLSIKSKAFKGCTSLANITLPDNLAQIGSYAFDGCSNISVVTFISNAKFEVDPEIVDDEPDYDPSTTIAGLITTIEEGAFRNCTSLSAISLPFFINSIQTSVFEGCSNLASFSTMTGSTQVVKLASIGDKAFKNCTNLATIDSASTNSLQSIGAYSFENCSSLTTINLKVVTSYPDGAFRNCSSLATMSIAAAVNAVGEEAFKNCKELSSFSASIKEVYAGAFENCESILSINLASSSSEIGANAFKGCILLEAISIPKSVVSIGDGAFSGCRNAMTITFEDGSALEAIGAAAFANCSLVQEIILPEAVSVISDNAFYGCSKLEYIEIGEEVVYIGTDAFALTTNLEIKLLGTDVPYIAGDILTGATGYTIYVRDGYANAYKTATGWNKYVDNYEVFTYLE